MSLLDLAARMGLDPAHTPIVLTYPHPHSDFAIFTGTALNTQAGTARTLAKPTPSLSSNCSRPPLDGFIPHNSE